MRIPQILITALLTVPLALTGCGDKDGKQSTENPDDGEGGGDPLEQLKATPDRIQAEIDTVIAPIDEAEAIMAEVEAMPAKFDLTLEDFKGVVQASFDSADGTVVISADLSIADEAKAEFEAQIQALVDLKGKLAATPDTVKTATENMVAIAAETVELAAKATASLTAKAKVAMGEKKAEIEQQIAELETLKGQIMTQIDDAKATFTELPGRAAEVGANFTASFAGSAGTSEGADGSAG